jgi:asparagine synthase (glutamine-hydrolysing)
MEASSRKVQRRGPDKTNIVLHPHFFMAFHRLAFHDLSPLGDQPMIFHDGDLTTYLVANGEIYNHKVLLHKYSFTTRSKNDCEVIYPLYRYFHGDIEKTVRALDGEFVFVMITVKGSTLHEIVAVRDPFGVRPLFFSVENSDGLQFSSLASALPPGSKPFPPASILRWTPETGLQWSVHYVYPEFLPSMENRDEILCDLLIDAVRKRTDSERPLACLLSGGLDSSLVCGILVRRLGLKNLHTFSIGMEGSTDLEYAQEVASFLGTQHHTVHFTPEQGLAAIDAVIEACETWDITTIRASVGQFLLAQYISKHTDFKAILNGDGADEAMMGYLYWYNAPTPLDAHLESIQRLQEIHLYDGLRVDRCLGHFGLEARVPYLDKDFVNFIMATPLHLRMPTPTRMEKFLIRNAFATHYPDILPDSVLWRKKEAFSDGVSSQKESWFQTIQRDMETRVSDTEFESSLDLGFPERPPTKEAWYYQKKFLERFGLGNTSSLIPHYWLPKWSGEEKEPSARVLSVYSSSTLTK